MTLDLDDSNLITDGEFRSLPLGRLALQLDTHLFFVLFLRCIVWSLSNATMIRMVVSSQECW